MGLTPELGRFWASQVKNPLANVGDVGRKDRLEKGMATHSSVLAWEIPRTEEPGRLQFIGLQRAGHDWSGLAHSTYKQWDIATQKKKKESCYLQHGWTYRVLVKLLSEIIKWNKSGRESQILYEHIYIWNLKNETNEQT